MKLRVLTLLGLLAFTAGSMIQAQDYDDIYYDGSSSSTKVKKETKKVETRAGRATVEVLPRYSSSATSNYQTDRDVDEYNRHGAKFEYDLSDTLDVDSLRDRDVFANTQRIERFYNPDIVISCNDGELVELYYNETPTVNIIIGTNYGYSPRVGWGFGWGTYCYDPWYDPWYPTRWYGYYRPFGWGFYATWHGPYYYEWGWGWSRPFYRHHYAGWHGWGYGRRHYWDRPGHYYASTYHHGHYTTGRRPGDGRSHLSGAANRPYTRSGSSSYAGVRGGSRTGVGTGSISNGRQRPSSYSNNSSGMYTGRQRPSGSVGNTGNIGRSTTSRGSSSGWSGGSVRSRGASSSSSSSYGTSRSSSPSRSYSPSSSGYSGSRSSGYSSGSSRSSSGYSGGGYSGGSRGGGGYSGGGGGGGRSGGGGGGHRR